MWEPEPGAELTRDGYPYAVYYLFDHDLEPLYIGRTVNVFKRIAAHSTWPWWPHVGAFSLDFYRTYAEVFNAERQAIKDHQPWVNEQVFDPSPNPPTTPPRRPTPKPKPDGPRWVTTAVAARQIGMSPAWLRMRAMKGELEAPMCTPGRHYRWDVPDLERQIREKLGSKPDTP